ncbi:MAG: 4-hydroxybenzoyl-CoA reductase subunit alpha, partial [Alphaproteobacteria bacterium]|nr:4-hydroxybenzoyl-CoA reductase subunit alpha [Alphaproteobacteria bacterium]
MNKITPIQSIGIPKPLVDGPEKTTGKAMFAADFQAVDALVGRILRSPLAHAKIVAIDTSKAEALPGVLAVITEADCADSYGVLPIAMNEWALARHRVRYRGEPVAAVAAVNVATAQQALDLIDVTYEELPAYFTADEARAEGAMKLHDDKPGNIEREVDFDLGDVDAGMAEADLVRELDFHCA